MEPKKWYQSKTLWFNLLLGTGGAVTLIANLVTGTMTQPEFTAGLFALGSGVVNFILRIITKQPIE